MNRFITIFSSFKENFSSSFSYKLIAFFKKNYNSMIFFIGKFFFNSFKRVLVGVIRNSRIKTFTNFSVNSRVQKTRRTRVIFFIFKFIT